MVRVDLSGAAAFFDPAGQDYAAAAKAHRDLVDGTGAGSEFTGWLNLPARIKDGELKSILAAAQKIRSRSKALVVIGIGGSYLGPRAAIELVKGQNHNLKDSDPQVFFAGNNLSTRAWQELCGLLEESWRAHKSGEIE